MLQLTGGGYTAVIDPARGGSCIRLSRFGAEALRTPQGPQSYAKNPFLYGTPLLFFPNRISGARFSFEGREYLFPVNEPATGCFLHGTLHETPFDVAETGAGTALLHYTATEERLYLSFPHAFSLHLCYTLDENGLRQQAAITNDSPQNMPVALGFHTTFNCPFARNGHPESMRFFLDTSAEYGRDPATYLPDGTVFAPAADQTAFASGAVIPCRQPISRLFRMGAQKEMRLMDEENHLMIRYQAGQSYGYWMVYNGGSADFLCVEPQSWLSNCPNAPFPRSQSGFDFLAPGETRMYETRLQIERTGYED